jgi:hypothetical protein
MHWNLNGSQLKPIPKFLWVFWDISRISRLFIYFFIWILSCKNDGEPYKSATANLIPREI